MGCNCSQGQNAMASPMKRNPNPSPQGVPAVAGTRIEFFFVGEDGEERGFSRLSEAKKEGVGSTIKTRRVGV